MIKQVQILQGLPAAIVGLREKRSAYVTNRILKTYDLFICLKAMTTSGLIKDYPSQMEGIKTFCKCGKQTFYTRLKELVAEGVVTVKKRNIHLTSWNNIAEKYEIPTIKYHTIQYDTEKPEQTIEYFIRGAEFDANKAAQLKQIKRKIDKTPERKTAFEQFQTKQGKKVDNSLEAWHQVQKDSFATGAAEYDVIHSINVDTNRSCKGIQRTYNFHSNRSASYMKRQLEARGMATIINREDPVCRFDGSTSAKKERGKTTLISSVMNLINPVKVKKGIKNSRFTTFFKNNAKVWRLVDDIQINKSLFSM